MYGTCIVAWHATLNDFFMSLINNKQMDLEDKLQCVFAFIII